LLQGDEDPVVDPRSARIVYDLLGTGQCTLRMVPAAQHGILNEDIGGTQDAILAFLDALPANHQPPFPGGGERRRSA